MAEKAVTPKSHSARCIHDTYLMQENTEVTLKYEHAAPQKLSFYVIPANTANGAKMKHNNS